MPANTDLLDLRGLPVTVFASGGFCVFNDKDASPDYGSLACRTSRASRMWRCVSSATPRVRRRAMGSRATVAGGHPDLLR